MGCENIGSGLWMNGTRYYSDSACSKEITATIDTLTTAQLQDGIATETATDQENNDWIKYLQNQSKGITSATGWVFSGRYGVLLIGGIVFIGVLILWNFFGKGKK